MGGLPIDLIRKLTVVLLIDRHVEEGYFLVCFPFNGELDRWFNVVYVGDLARFVQGQT